MKDRVRKILIDEPHSDPRTVANKMAATVGAAGRDWRRIAITEASNCANNGFIAGVPVGGRVRALEAYDGACDWCLHKSNGRVYNVVDPDDPNKNVDTDVWIGKTNDFSKPQSQWIQPAGPVHPHCRKVWLFA
jgi:hypothetical protein